MADSRAAVFGPDWTDGDGGRHPGRFPLAVERFAMAQVGHLLPGITTVTPHARYYALHAAVFVEARSRNLDDAATRRLLRRSEVVIGAVSLKHAEADPVAHEGMRSAHGSDYIGPRVAEEVDIDALAADGAYAQAGWGFWGPYVGSEFAMGLLATEGGRTVEGPRVDIGALRTGFRGLFELASRTTLTPNEVADAAPLCLCQCKTSADGLMLRRVLIPKAASAMHHDDRRAQTLRMLLRLSDLTAAEAQPSLERTLVFGDISADPKLQALDVLPAWTGVVLRAFTVAAWRNLWRHLVDSIDVFMTVRALGEALADQLPAESVRAFVNSRPPGMRGVRPIEAEFSPGTNSLGLAERYLSRLVIGAGRYGRLEGRAHAYFQGQQDERYQQLTPGWLQAMLEEWADRPLRDFAIWLTEQLVARSQRVALSKASFNPKTGQFQIPTRVYVRDGHIFKDSDEGGGGIALRWSSAFDVMTGAGFVDYLDGKTIVTALGRTA